ncbi:MAG: helix-turn-helix transcriptional regulator [Cyanobacteria bacterium P01_G01_bin.49]
MAVYMEVVKTTVIQVNGLGDRIRQARLQLPRGGKTWQELCEEVGISRSHWSNLENEKTKMPLDVLRKIEKALNVDLKVKLDD